jgi:CelD/BcsL family acetyltransferase involved in cellulose biosynthesis
MEFELHQTFPRELHQEWNNLLAETSSHVPFLRYEYLETWWQTRGGGEWPYDTQLALITARENGQLVGIAPLFLAIWEEQPTLLLVGSIEVSDYLDLIARDRDMQRFTDELLDYLNREPILQEWKSLDLYNVLENAVTIGSLEKRDKRLGWKYHVEPFRPALTLALPGDWETYLEGIDKKQRHEIRRKMRRAYSTESQVRWYYVQDPNTLDSEIDAFLTLMAKDEEKARFLTPLMRENFRNTMHCAFNEGCLHLSFFEIDGHKASSYASFDYLNTLWIYNSGIDPAFIDLSPGWVLLSELIKWAIENKHTTFDFMRGDEDYKLRFGATKRDVLRLTLKRI